MAKFSKVHAALEEWLVSFKWVQKILPYHLHIMFGGLGLMFLYKIVLSADKYVHFLYVLNSIGYWAFLLGALLTLVSPNLKYVPYSIWGYVLIYLFPFQSFSFSSLLRVAIFAILGFLLFQYITERNKSEA